MNVWKKYIIFVLISLIIFISGFFLGSKITYKPTAYNKYFTDETTGVQYIIIVSKEGDVAIFPRLNSNGTLHTKSKKNIIFVENDIKGELNE